MRLQSHRQRPRKGSAWCLCGAAFLVNVLMADAALACDADALLDKAVSTYRPSGRSPSSFHGSGKLELHSGKGALARAFVERYLFPTKVRLEYGTGFNTSVMATDGKRAWSVSKDGPTWSERGHFVVPVRLRDLGRLLFEVKSRGRIECVAGAVAPLQRVAVSPDGREMILLDISSATGLVHRYEGESPGTAGKADVIRVDLDDYQQFGGFWVAMSLRTKVNGQLVSRTRLRRVEVNRALPPPLFEKPDGVVTGSPLKEL